jgi:hypothetical protein
MKMTKKGMETYEMHNGAERERIARQMIQISQRTG